MCGIVGQARYDGATPDREILGRMCAALEHRGPDSRGIHTEPGAGLGVQRLRIIDLETGDQPIFNEDRSVVVVLNGEIYNFRELGEELRGRGHRFSTRSDTEVIVHLYEEIGPTFVERLYGMFGLALWDRRRRRLLLARDRVGKKPLFYALRGEVLSFASELGALLQDPTIPRELGLEELDAYLAFRYVPSPRTAFRAVRKLPPAHVLSFQDGGARVERYWRLDFSAKRDLGSVDDALEELRAHLRRAVRRRMIADVPLGAFLSGGIDSGAIVAAMAEASAQPVKTFSIGFRSTDLDERPLSRLVAERFATDHHELVVEPKAVEVLPRIVRHHGEPFADATSVPTFYLAEMAREHVTVALNGDGGDEGFAGYSRYVAGLLGARLERMPGVARDALAALARRLPPDGRVDSWRNRVRRLGGTLGLDAAGRHLAYMTDLQGLQRERVYSEEFRAALGSSGVEAAFRELWAAASADNVLDRMLEVDTLTYLPDDLLAKVDIATMACSLEARAPLLDYRLVEWAARLPVGLKQRGFRGKRLLRELLARRMGTELFERPKMGFAAPIGSWLRRELRELAVDTLLDERTAQRGYLERTAVEELLRSHLSGEVDHSRAIWTILMLELWHREVVEAPAGSPTSEVFVDPAGPG
jgi:asparagine synthase (glutamine-hydrolysing)